jgi:hypothetical protein
MTHERINPGHLTSSADTSEEQVSIADYFSFLWEPETTDE